MGFVTLRKSASTRCVGRCVRVGVFCVGRLVSILGSMRSTVEAVETPALQALFVNKGCVRSLALRRCHFVVRGSAWTHNKNSLTVGSVGYVVEKVSPVCAVRAFVAKAMRCVVVVALR